jgi:choline kinase
MKSIILSAGIGSRIKDITKDEIPKCLLAINGKAILEHQIKAMRAGYVNKIILVTGFKHEKIKEKLIGYDDVLLIHNAEFATTNILASFQLALKKCDDGDDLFVVAGDVVFEAAILKAIVSSNDFDVLVAVDFKKADPEAVKVLTEGSRITRFGKEIDPKHARGEFLGLMFIKKSVINEMKALIGRMLADKQCKKGAYLFDMLNVLINIHGKNIGFIDIAGLIWEEVDCKEDWVRANRLFNEKFNAKS